jgi:hypothetical protein
VHVRTLTNAEAQALAEEIAAGDAARCDQAALALADGGGRSLAEVYAALR